MSHDESLIYVQLLFLDLFIYAVNSNVLFCAGACISLMDITLHG
jgi:hypothetical protein